MSETMLSAQPLPWETPDAAPPRSPTSVLPPWYLDASLIERRAQRLGVSPLDVLQAQRDELVQEAAPRQALRDTFDARRRAERSKIGRLINHERRERGEKEVSVTAMEEFAAGDVRYIEFLDEAEDRFDELALLNARIQAITERIAYMKAEQYRVGQEARTV